MCRSSIETRTVALALALSGLSATAIDEG